MVRNKKLSAAAALSLSALLMGCSGQPRLLFSTAKNDTIIYTGAMAGKEHGFAAGELGNVRYTEDGGKTWQKGENHSLCLFSVSPVNENVCYAAGNGKAFTKTIDGGKTWSALKEHPANKAKGVTFKNEESGCLWTTSAAYEYSAATDQWTAFKNPEGCGLVESAFSIAPGEMLLCGSNGMIYRTSDYGVSWLEVQKIFDKKNDVPKPVIGQWTKTSEFDSDGKTIRFAYLAEENYNYTLFVFRSNDGGQSFLKESETKLKTPAASVTFNTRNEISVYNTDCTMDVYRLK